MTAENKNAAVIETPEIMKAPPSPIAWNAPHELSYSMDPLLAPPDHICCFACGTVLFDNQKLLKCAKCRVASYCNKECQVEDWTKNKHKRHCENYQLIGPNMTLRDNETKEQQRNLIFARIRFYACPYAVHKTRSLGRGFLFVQSSGTLALMSLTKQMDSYGRKTPMRSVLLHYLTLGEFDRDLCRDDFEMTVVRTELQTAVQDYDEEKQVVLLIKFRCGHLVVGVAPLVPDYGICRKLGMDYYSDNKTEAALQLNLDDM